MKTMCRELQERLAGEGAQALRADADAQSHLEACTDCFQVLEQLARLDEALAAMPSADAPESVVSGLLARVAGEGGLASATDAAAVPARTRRFVRPPVLWGLATAAAAVVVVGFLTPVLRRDLPEARQARYDMEPGPPPATTAPAPPASKDDENVAKVEQYVLNETIPGGLGDKQTSESERAKLHASGDVYDAEAKAQPKNEKSKGAATRSTAPPLGGEADERQRRANLDQVGGVEGGVAGGVAGGQVGGLPESRLEPSAVRIGGSLKPPQLLRRVEPALPEAARVARVQGVVVLEIRIGANGKVENVRVLRSVPGLDAAAAEAVKQWVYAPTILQGTPVPVLMTVTISFRLPESPQDEPGAADSAELARAFLAERAATEGVAFQAANGYWANTYVPGDPALRLLRARLVGWDRSALPGGAASAWRLHDASSQPSQPFDSPHKAGLAVYLSADRRGIEKPGRMLLQVGLKGSPLSGGERSPMNVGLVLDLRGDVPTEAAADMRAIALAMAEARQAGDRFSLTVAGRPGGRVVGPDRFAHGPVVVALDRVLADGEPPATDPTLDLADAVAAAFREADRCDDPDAALGSSAVVLVTGQSLGDSADVLADLAHQGAVAGVPLSLVGIGAGAPLEELNRLALAGQGARRVLEMRSDALRLVEAMLADAGSVVARAVRLRIRLAPGVRLVGILGSRRLDDAQAQRVREVERGIDLQLSRNLGIDSDRGEDEDGIQIVIPRFHAGDAHVVLLDVVTAGAGAIADVGVRYKDVVFRRNGLARASLSLPAGDSAAGPLERNVLDNLLAFRLAQSLAEAGTALEADQPEQAMRIVRQAHALRAGLIAGVPGLRGDAEPVRDMAMLQEYARVLAGGESVRTQRASIADSLRYAARLKLLPRPAPQASGTF